MAKNKQSDSLRAAAPRAPSTSVADALVTTTRIDPPHVLAGSTSDEESTPEAPIALSALASAAASPAVPPVNLATDDVPAWQFATPSPDGIAFEQMQNQAAQLAAQLAKQQMALDHREAEINARAAAVENQVRVARLWLSEKLELLARSKAEASWAHDENLTKLAEGARSLDSPGPADGVRDDFPLPLSDARQAWRQEKWQEQFEQWRADREAGLDAEAASPPDAAAGQAANRSAQPAAVPVYRRKEAEERMQATEQRLAARAAELEARRAELLADRRTLEAEREAFQVEKQQERWRLAEQRRTMSEKLTRQRARLRRRRDDFDARETALRQLRADLLRAQQQTLEMRLAAEELWARLRSKGATADSSSSRSKQRDRADEQQMGAA